MKRENLIASDGKEISFVVWDEVTAPKAVLQIVHGMAEHVARYDEFAKFMNDNGFIVAGDDHRAHGHTDKERLGLRGEGDLFEKTVDDEMNITKTLFDRYNLPIIIMGHSYGSFLTQRYLTYGANNIAGAILSGSAFMSGAIVNLGYALAKSKCKKHADEEGTTFANMTFKKYDKKFKQDGINGWLSRDAKEVGKYNVDPLCGFTCSNGFYMDFFRGLKIISKHAHDLTRRDLKLLILSGDDDMVGGRGKLVRKLRDRYLDLGFNPSMKLYDGGRHEMVNETNRVEFFGDILEFVKSCINIHNKE